MRFIVPWFTISYNHWMATVPISGRCIEDTGDVPRVSWCAESQKCVFCGFATNRVLLYFQQLSATVRVKCHEGDNTILQRFTYLPRWHHYPLLFRTIYLQTKNCFTLPCPNNLYDQAYNRLDPALMGKDTFDVCWCYLGGIVNGDSGSHWVR